MGQVNDPQGAPIAGATVQIRSSTTNVSREVTTSASRRIQLSPTDSRLYTVTVHQPGFRDKAIEVTLGVSQRLQADFTMELGTVSEQVIVEARPAAIETESSEIGQIKQSKEIVDLPLNTRNFTQLVQLAPGVLTGVGGASGVLGYTSGRGTNGAVINGAPVEDVTYLIDGINSVDTDAGVLIFFPPVDSIYEFRSRRVRRRRHTAAARESSMSLISRGPMSYHGTLYEFLRNSAFDAKNFFDSAKDPIPPFKLNQFGFNVGGPVQIPKLFNGKDRLFFFFDYEGKRVRQAQTFLSTVPIAAFRTRRFLGLAAANDRLRSATNPRTPLPGNIMPPTAINPTSARMMALYPGAEPSGGDQQLPVQSRADESGRSDQHAHRLPDQQLRDLRALLMGRRGYLQSRQSAGARDRRWPGPPGASRHPEQAGCNRLRPRARARRNTTNFASATRECSRASTTRARNTAISRKNSGFRMRMAVARRRD